MTDIHDSHAIGIREAIRQLRELPGDLEAEDDPAFTTEQVNFLEKRLYEVRSLLEEHQPRPGLMDITLYVHQLLGKHRQVAAIWSIEDVQHMRPHLTDDQAWEILEEVGASMTPSGAFPGPRLRTLPTTFFLNQPTHRRQP